MQNIIDGMRQVIGQPVFYDVSGALDYGAVFEYLVASILACLVVSSFFKLLIRWCER